MEIGPRIVVFDPRKDQEWARTLTEIHRREEKLLEACVPSEYISGETDDGQPIWADAAEELGPETDVFEKVQEWSSLLPDLSKAYRECGGASSKFSFRMKAEAHNFFADAAAIDNYFLPELSPSSALKSPHEAKAVVLFYDNEYYGHVWYFTHPRYPEYCGIYGMKSSLVNLLYRLSCPGEYGHRKGIAKRILTDGVFSLAREEGRKVLIVPWPLPPMIPILETMGFTEHNEQRMTPEREFLKDLASTSNYFTLNLR